MIHAYLNRIGTAVPANESQQEFLDTLDSWIPDLEVVNKLRVIARRAGIEQRHTVLENVIGPRGSGAFYEVGNFPGVAKRMEMYRQQAPGLAVEAVRRLAAKGVELRTITHLIVTSCTGFYAPGLDVDLIRELGLPRSVNRILVGFMGCYAGISGLRVANDIVRASPEARVLIVNLELCTLHLRQDAPMDQLVAAMLFSDGCAASLVSSKPEGFRLDSFTSVLSLEDADKMSWLIGDQGFEMSLDAAVPQRIENFLTREPDLLERAMNDADSLWAIHPGGRAILEAVQRACNLTPLQLAPAREVLAQFGNMSSATVMFVFEKLLAATDLDREAPGVGMAFGPGLTLEAVTFTKMPGRTPSHRQLDSIQYVHAS